MQILMQFHPDGPELRRHNFWMKSLRVNWWPNTTKDTILRMKTDLWLNETQPNVERASKSF